MGKDVKEKIANARLRKQQKEYQTKYGLGTIAITESYVITRKGIKIIRTRTRYRKGRK